MIRNIVEYSLECLWLYSGDVRTDYNESST